MSLAEYKIRYSSLDDFFSLTSNQIEEWNTQLNNWEESYTELINLEEFQGESAVSAKQYLGEVHSILLEFLRTTIMRFQSEYLLYKDGFYDIESNIYAILPQETIHDVQNAMKTKGGNLETISTEVNTALSSISDIFLVYKPRKYDLQSDIDGMEEEIRKFDESLEAYEDAEYTKATGDLKTLIDSMQVLFLNYASNGLNITSYDSNDLPSINGIVETYSLIQNSYEYFSDNTDAITDASNRQAEVYAQMQADYEAACAARQDTGTAKILIGAGAVIVGGAAIILTAGAAAPVVATAYVAGSCSVAYGASNMFEGGTDYYYGSIGDLTSASINPLRDTVFMGNQNAYDAFGKISTTVAGLCVPVGKAVNVVAGSSASVVAKTVGVTVGKEMLKDKASDVITNSTTKIINDKFDLNQTESVILNAGVNMVVGMGVDEIDGKISGLDPYAAGMSYDDAKIYNEQTFSDGMNLDDALRYDTYWDTMPNNQEGASTTSFIEEMNLDDAQQYQAYWNEVTENQGIVDTVPEDVGLESSGTTINLETIKEQYYSETDLAKKVGSGLKNENVNNSEEVFE